MQLHELLRRLVPLALAGAAAACTTAPVARVPEPLPEALEWARPETAGAFLGLKTRENDSGSLDDLFFEPGVRVSRVVESSPAAAAGLEAGDLVLRAGGEAVDDPAALEALVAEAGAESELLLEVRRGDTVFEVPVVLASEGEGAGEILPLYRVDASRSRAGWATGRGGVVLVSAPEDGPTARAGLETGAVVIAVEERSVHSARALIRELERHAEGSTVALTVAEGDGARTVDLRLAEAPRKLTSLSVPILFTYESDVDGQETRFVLIDLYVISLFRYHREGAEREYRVLRWIRYASGVGELSE